MKTKICLAIAILCSVIIGGCGGVKAYVPGSGLCSEIFAFLETTSIFPDDSDTVQFFFSLSEFEGLQGRGVVPSGEEMTLSIGGLPQGITVSLNGDGPSTTIFVDEEETTVVDVEISVADGVNDGSYPVTVLLQREGCEDVEFEYVINVNQLD